MTHVWFGAIQWNYDHHRSTGMIALALSVLALVPSHAPALCVEDSALWAPALCLVSHPVQHTAFLAPFPAVR